MGNPGVGAQAPAVANTAGESFDQSLVRQLAQVGYMPTDVTYLALSRSPWDHVANDNAFGGSTLAGAQGGARSHVSAARRRAAAAVGVRGAAGGQDHASHDNEYDVFGDGTVVIKSAAGHTPRHNVLYVKRARTGDVVLSGDLSEWLGRDLSISLLWECESIDARAAGLAEGNVGSR